MYMMEEGSPQQEIDKNGSFDRYLLNMTYSKESGDEFNKVKIRLLLNEACKYNINSVSTETKKNMSKQEIIKKFNTFYNTFYNSIRDISTDLQLSIISSLLVYHIDINNLSVDNLFYTRINRQTSKINLIEALNLSKSF